MGQVFPGPGQKEGPAGGDLSGNYPNPTVAQIQGTPVDTTTPTDGQALKYSSGSGKWTPSSDTSGVSSVKNSDSSLTISPTTGAVVASLNVAHGNTFTAQQTMNGGIMLPGTAGGGNASSIEFSGAGSAFPTSNGIGLDTSGGLVLTSLGGNHAVVTGTTAAARNTLDDGTGAATFTSNVDVQGNLIVEKAGTTRLHGTVDLGSAATDSCVLNIYDATPTQVAILTGSGGNCYLKSPDGNSLLGFSNGVPMTFINGAAAQVGLIVRAAAAQSADIIDVQNSAGTTIASFKSDGSLTTQNLTTVGAVTRAAVTDATAFQVSAVSDKFLTVEVSASVAGTVKVEVSPDNVTFTTVAATLNVATTGSTLVSLYVRKGWYVKLTKQTGTITYANYQAF